MSRRTQYTVRFDAPAEHIYDQLTSEDYWRRLTEVYRGLNARSDVTEFRSGDTGTDIVLRQVASRDDMPAVAQKVVPVSELVITRTQHFDPFDHAKRRADGSFDATMLRAPGRLSGQYAITETAAGSQMLITSMCKVSIPLLGGTIEQMILSNMRHLYDGERQFTIDRLAGRH
jgi:hypothetical protein